jgi:hypothetical protein
MKVAVVVVCLVACEGGKSSTTAGSGSAVDAALTFAGDTITGTAPTATYQFMEDGEAGENLWGCTAKQPQLSGKRIAD